MKLPASPRPRVLTSCVLTSVLLSSCAYYNGMYNAKHFAKQAERSERLGRPTEAVERWRVAAVHADSVVARHPRSRWVDDALLLRARALVRISAWSDAGVAAERALALPLDPAQREDAWLYLGLSRLGMRQFPEAIAALDSATVSQDGARRSAALLGRGRALLASGRPGEALEDFRGSSEEDAGYERPHAALAAGDYMLAALFADSLALRQPFREAQWLLLLDSLERAGLAARVSHLTDQLSGRSDMRIGSRARLLLADGERRLQAGDDSAAAARFREVQRIAGDSVEAGAAKVRLIMLAVRGARDSGDLAAARGQLQDLGSLGGAMGLDAAGLAQRLHHADSLVVAPGAADAFWFLRGELLRDSLGARRAAARAFGEMPERFPDSPWTPKGILAAIALDHPAADSLRALLLSRYASNPYVLAATGSAEGQERYAALEDSLRIALLAAPGATVAADERRRAPPTQPQPARPTTRPSIEP